MHTCQRIFAIDICASDFAFSGVLGTLDSGQLSGRLNPPLFTERCHSAFVVAWERRTEKLKASQSVRAPAGCFLNTVGRYNARFVSS